MTGFRANSAPIGGERLPKEFQNSPQKGGVRERSEREGVDPYFAPEMWPRDDSCQRKVPWGGQSSMMRAGWSRLEA